MAQEPQDYTDMAVVLAGLACAFIAWVLMRIIVLGLHAAQSHHI